MISYELAKQLTEEGFPSKLNVPICKKEYEHNRKECEYVLYPYLSELIEACGDRLRWIENRIHKGCAPEDKWLAQARGIKVPHPTLADKIINTKDTVCRGSTPEEAVARLWLSLPRPISKDAMVDLLNKEICPLMPKGITYKAKLVEEVISTSVSGNGDSIETLRIHRAHADSIAATLYSKYRVND